ncbi:MAG: hypothetical protein H0W73_04020 [Bacteroidetes bacterium]|nr:hypothetical protein [Bacteroidota bacterium]
MIKPWEEIINTSIIGTDKKQINTQVLHPSLNSLLEEVKKGTDDKEEQFLRQASIIYNYRRAGFNISCNAVPLIEPCAEEILKYCSSQAEASLQTTLGDENLSLLYFWLLQCSKNNKITPPHFIPTLLEFAEKNKDLRILISTCLGERGKWITAFNPNWKFGATLSYKEVFDHGKADERKNALIQWRKDSPAEARETLASVWKEEQAATKADLLSTLEINLNEDDEAFLTEALKEKSQKVKDIALKLLKQMPDSFIVKEIWEFTKPLVSIKKSGALLGLINKEVLNINLAFEIPEKFKSYGISHIDASKNFTEKEFTLDQLIGVIPPTLWEKHLNLNAYQILELFNKKEETKKFIPSLAMSANTFKNPEWGIILYKEYKQVCYSVIEFFSQELKEDIALALLQESKNIYAFLPKKETEWSQKFVMALLQKTSQEPYAFSKNYYKNIIHHFPVSILEKIDQIQVNDPLKKSYWDTISEEIKKMLSIKKQIVQSF